MGLNCTHGAFDGSYGSFMNFRIAVAKTIGVEYFELLNRIKFMDNAQEEFEKVISPEIDLYPLLNHSDCDGELSPEECYKTIQGLNKIKYDIDKEYFDTLMAFVKGCESAYKNKEHLGFR